MDKVKRIKILAGTGLIAALLGIYVTTLHIDALAKERYQYKRLCISPSFTILQSVIYFCVGNSHEVVKRQTYQMDTYSLASRNKQKIHTEVIDDAKLNKMYSRRINSTWEILLHYLYTQDVRLFFVFH